MNLTPLNIVIGAVLCLFGIGFYGLLVTRNLIKVVVGLQILVKGALLALVTAGVVSGKPALGQSLALTVIVADTIVAVIGLALAVQVRKHFGTLDINTLRTLKR
jgi:NADH-quinone oxidoreductase subunit K